jgi:FAD/FMN-containing dehydrogenase
MIDLSPMRGIRVDPAARRAWVEPGVLLGEYDHEAQAYGLASPAGTVTHTGAAGLTLGGGFGRIARKHGLACDNLTEVNIITADGQFHRANAHENADLFWAVRGGGGNFGVATSFQYQLHPLGPTVIGGVIEYPIEQARDALRACFEYGSTARDDLAVDPTLYATPDQGARLQLDVSYSGPPELAEKAIAPLRRMGKPVVDTVGPLPYVKLQASIDEGLEFGGRYYIKSGFVNEMPQAFVDALIEPFRRSPPPRFALIFQQAGGAIARVAENATAFANRQARYDFLVLTRWADAAHDAEFTEPVREVWNSMKQFTSGFYVNTAPGEDSNRIRANYRGNYDRLVRLKDRYDPTNLFRLNANIKPSRLSRG